MKRGGFRRWCLATSLCVWSLPRWGGWGKAKTGPGETSSCLLPGLLPLPPCSFDLSGVTRPDGVATYTGMAAGTQMWICGGCPRAVAQQSVWRVALVEPFGKSWALCRLSCNGCRVGAYAGVLGGGHQRAWPLQQLQGSLNTQTAL